MLGSYLVHYLSVVYGWWNSRWNCGLPSDESAAERRFEEVHPNLMSAKIADFTTRNDEFAALLDLGYLRLVHDEDSGMPPFYGVLYLETMKNECRFKITGTPKQQEYIKETFKTRE